jgi:hypothetical protein
MLQRMNILDIEKEIHQSLLDTIDVYVEQQRDQMLHGKNKKGTLIGKYRNPVYAKNKFEMNGLAGYKNVDLLLTGRFQSKIFVEVRDKELFIYSHDSKADKLESKYGDEIFGLSKKYKIPFVDANRTAFLNRIKNIVYQQQREEILI